MPRFFSVSVYFLFSALLYITVLPYAPLNTLFLFDSSLFCFTFHFLSDNDNISMLLSI